MSLNSFHTDFEIKRSQLRKHQYLRDLPDNESASLFASISLARFASNAYKNRGALPYLQPRGGFTLWEQQRNLSLDLASAGADFIPLTIDSHTRQNDYDRAKLLLDKSEETGQNLLNGFPLLAHGVIATRQIFEGIDLPVSLRHGTPDARLLVEAALDAGISEIEGGGLCYCIPYSRSYPIDRALLNWQYIDRLCAVLSTPGREIHRESFGALTATMVPPFMVVVIQVLELLMAAEQGVQSFAISFSQTGSFSQDIATSRALKSVAKNMLDLNGHHSTTIRLVFHQWMGAFPSDRIQAEALISQGAIIAALCDVDKVVVKTRTEALGIPDSKSNADAVSMSRYAMSLCCGDYVTSDEILEEQNFIESAASYILELIISQSSAPLWEKISHSVRLGIIDVPFSPHQENVNQLWTMRDSSRNIRVADAGLIPLPDKFLKREIIKLGKISNDHSFDRMLSDILIMTKGSN